MTTFYYRTNDPIIRTIDPDDGDGIAVECRHATTGEDLRVARAHGPKILVIRRRPASFYITYDDNYRPRLT